MSKAKNKGRVHFTLQHPNAAGIDIGVSCHYVCVGPDEVRRFGAFSGDLNAMADWLLSLGVTTAAMESTGVYWVNLYDVLEQKGIEVCLANARYVKNVPGRKSDVSDCQWIWQLHSYGLLSGSFIAEEPIRELRTYVRHRERLEHQKVDQVNLMNKALQLLNVKLRQVLSKTQTDVGMNIIRAIVAGERDGLKMSEQLHNPNMKASKKDLAKALQGVWKPEHLFCLTQALNTYDFIIGQMRLCEKEIERCLDLMNGGDGTTSLKKKTSVRQNNYAFKASIYLKNIFGVDLTQIEGLQEKTLVTVFSEVGTDMSKWKTAAHFASWLGLTPKPKKTGEKNKGHFKDSVAGRAGAAIRKAAASLHDSHGSLGAFYRRMLFRKGSIAAIKATGRKLAVIIWHVAQGQQPYQSQTAVEYELAQKELEVKRLKKRAARLGLVLQTAQA